MATTAPSGFSKIWVFSSSSVQTTLLLPFLLVCFSSFSSFLDFTYFSCFLSLTERRKTSGSRRIHLIPYIRTKEGEWGCTISEMKKRGEKRKRKLSNSCSTWRRRRRRKTLMMIMSEEEKLVNIKTWHDTTIKESSQVTSRIFTYIHCSSLCKLSSVQLVGLFAHYVTAFRRQSERARATAKRTR